MSCPRPRHALPRQPAPSEMSASDIPQRELQQLREEHAVLLELLTLDRTALRSFMTVAARTLIHVRALLARPAREPGLYLKKLALLRSRYAQLLQRADALPLPTLARQFPATLAAAAPWKSASVWIRRSSASSRFPRKASRRSTTRSASCCATPSSTASRCRPSARPPARARPARC